FATTRQSCASDRACACSRARSSNSPEVSDGRSLRFDGLGMDGLGAREAPGNAEARAVPDVQRRCHGWADQMRRVCIDLSTKWGRLLQDAITWGGGATCSPTS